MHYLIQVTWTRLAISLMMSFSKSSDPALLDGEKRDDSADKQVTRIRRVRGELCLDTALQRWRDPSGRTVDLVGAIHLGRLDYYRRISAILELAEVVLYEMVGGELFDCSRFAPEHGTGPQALGPPPLGYGPGARPFAPDGRKPDGILNQIYENVGAALGLQVQASAINYRQPHFIHADLTMHEFKKAQKERGESLLKFLFKWEKKQRKVAGKHWRPWRHWRAALADDAQALREELILQLGNNPDFLSDGQSDSVILGLRNQRCIETLDRELASGRSHIAIFYGAAHLPGLAQQIQQRGFSFDDRIWLRAW